MYEPYLTLENIVHIYLYKIIIYHNMTNNWKRLRRFFSLSAIFNNYGNRACRQQRGFHRGAMAPCLRKPPKLSEASPLAPECFRR